MWHFLWPDLREEDVPIASITNGVHTATWIARRMKVLFHEFLGPDWLENIDDQAIWEQVRDIPDDARLIREEQFGPILPVLRYSDLDDAIARANDTEYGLGGSVWSADRERAFAVATRLDAGTVWVNKHLDMQLDTPVGGAKQSGVGSELGQAGLEEYTQATIINLAK